MPFQRRRLKPRENLSQLYEDNKPDKVLTGAFMSSMVGLLKQLGQLSSYSCEIFDELIVESENVAKRTQHLSLRAENVAATLQRVDALFDSKPPEYFYHTPHARVWQRYDRLSGSHFLASTRPLALQTRREEAAVAPALGSFQIPGMPKLNADAAYSDPNFFVMQWVEAEAARQQKAAEERRERRKQRKKKKKKDKPQTKRQVAAVKIKKYDARGAEFGTTSEQQVEAVLAVPDTKEVPVPVLLLPLPVPRKGRTHPIHEVVPAGSTEIVFHKAETILPSHKGPAAAAPPAAPSTPAPAPPAAAGGPPASAAPAAPTHSPPSQPPPGRARLPQYASGPPGPPSAPPSGPPPSFGPPGTAPPPPTQGPPAGGPPPVAVAPSPAAAVAAPPPPAAPAIPSAPSLSHVLQLGAQSKPAAAPTAPPPAASAVPGAPSAPPPVAAAARPAAVGSDSLMAAIRGGSSGLRKVQPREPKKEDDRDNLLSQIRSKVSLKKVDRSEQAAGPKQPKYDGGMGGTIYDILARRAAIAEDSESDSDSEWED